MEPNGSRHQTSYQCGPPDGGSRYNTVTKSAGIIARENAKAAHVSPEQGALEAFWSESPFAHGVLKSDTCDDEE